MNLERRPTGIIAALVYASGALFSVVSIGFVLYGAFGLDAANRDTLFTELRLSLLMWTLITLSGAFFAVVSLKFGQLSVVVSRAILAASCAIGLLAGAQLEWWQSLYFLFPPIILLLAFREEVHV